VFDDTKVAGAPCTGGPTSNGYFLMYVFFPSQGGSQGKLVKTAMSRDLFPRNPLCVEFYFDCPFGYFSLGWKILVVFTRIPNKTKTDGNF
jgi:hypothetical protein